MRLALTAVVLLAYLSGFAQTAKEEEEFPDIFEGMVKARLCKPFPTFTATTADTVLNNEKLKGKVVFVNLWFESCPPCITEFDGLNELYMKTADSAGFAFIAFTYETPKRCEEIRVKYGLKYPIVSVSHQDARRFVGSLGFPTNIIIDRRGAIRYIRSGGLNTKELATKYLMTVIYPQIIAALKAD